MKKLGPVIDGAQLKWFVFFICLLDREQFNWVTLFWIEGGFKRELDILFTSIGWNLSLINIRPQIWV